MIVCLFLSNNTLSSTVKLIDLFMNVMDLHPSKGFFPMTFKDRGRYILLRLVQPTYLQPVISQ